MTPRIKVEFQPKGHLYFINGEDAVSVTQMLEAEGLNSFEWCTEEDMKRGTAVHRIAELLAASPIQGETAEEVVRNSRWIPAATVPQSLVPYGFAAARYLLESGIRPLLVEQQVASAQMRVAGTLDLYGRMPDGTRLLIDFKSGQPKPAVSIQLACYAACLKETFDLDTDLMAAVWVRRDGTYKAFPPQPPGGANLAVARSALNLYHWRRKHRML
jgi:hypothetical protein